MSSETERIQFVREVARIYTVQIDESSAVIRFCPRDAGGNLICEICKVRTRCNEIFGNYTTAYISDSECALLKEQNPEYFL